MEPERNQEFRTHNRSLELDNFDTNDAELEEASCWKTNLMLGSEEERVH